MKGKPTKWSDEDIQYLKDHFATTWNKVLAEHFGLGWRTIVRKARELGLEKSETFRDNIDFTSFMKGNKPWNKGMKGKVLSPGCEKTWFQKGNKSIMADPKIHAAAQAVRNETIRKEKLRLKYGIPQKTKLNLKNIY